MIKRRSNEGENTTAVAKRAVEHVADCGDSRDELWVCVEVSGRVGEGRESEADERDVGLLLGNKKRGKEIMTQNNAEVWKQHFMGQKQVDHQPHGGRQ